MWDSADACKYSISSPARRHHTHSLTQILGEGHWVCLIHFLMQMEEIKSVKRSSKQESTYSHFLLFFSPFLLYIPSFSFIHVKLSIKLFLKNMNLKDNFLHQYFGCLIKWTFPPPYKSYKYYDPLQGSTTVQFCKNTIFICNSERNYFFFSKNLLLSTLLTFNTELSSAIISSAVLCDKGWFIKEVNINSLGFLIFLI